jgi:hypothetical protein
LNPKSCWISSILGFDARKRAAIRYAAPSATKPALRGAEV